MESIVDDIRATTSKVAPSHVCLKCRRSFSKTEHLRRHVRSHTKERPFSCHPCNKSFTRLDTLQRHQRCHNVQRSTNSKGASAADSEHLSPLSNPANLQTEVSEERSTANLWPTLPSPSGLERNESPQIPQLGQEADQALLHQQQFSPTGTDFNFEFWNDQPVPDADTFLLDTNFDLGGLDWTAITSGTPCLPTSSARPAALAPPLCEASGFADSIGTSVNLPKHKPCLLHNNISRLWYYNLRSDDSTSHHSPSNSDGSGDALHIDEQYRDNLSNKLQSSTCNISVDFLNLCLRLYFTRFHIIFPVLHKPSFRADARHPLLILSMCSIGSLFVGSPDALLQGTLLFSQLNKTILASWETYLSTNSCEALSMAQAALLGQTFGQLSGRSNELVMADALQGPMLTWARKLGAFNNHDQNLWQLLQGSTPADADRLWTEWVHREHLRRLTIALHIHDAEMAVQLHHDPLLRHFSVIHSNVFNDALFHAPTASAWYNLATECIANASPVAPLSVKDWMYNQSHNSNAISLSLELSAFAAYGLLENLNACILEARLTDELTAERKEIFTRGLIRWYEAYQVSAALDDDILGLNVLWHASFLNLLADFDLLERAIERDGVVAQENAMLELQSWITSPSALRSQFHATMILHRVMGMRLKQTPAIHLPRSIFWGCLVWLAHSLVGMNFLEERWRMKIFDFPETRLVASLEQDTFKLLMRDMSERVGQRQSSVIFAFVDIMKKLDKWGVAQKYAGIVVSVVKQTLDI